jgi:hypothetical protein
VEALIARGRSKIIDALDAIGYIHNHRLSDLWCYVSANCFSQLSQRIPAEYARLDIIINISSERLSPFSTRVSNNSTAEKAVFTILPSVHLSQIQVHTGGCCIDCKDCFVKGWQQIINMI